MPASDAIGFRRLMETDLELLHHWLQREHVARWWGAPPDRERLRADYLPMIRGQEPTDGYLILLGEQPIGFIQTYLLADWPSYWPNVDEAGASGVDLLIGEPDLIGQGLGPRAIRAFVDEIVFASPEVRACWADPAVDNRRSVRAFQKAGFTVMGDFWDEAEQKMERLVRLGRGEHHSSDA